MLSRASEPAGSNRRTSRTLRGATSAGRKRGLLVTDDCFLATGATVFNGARLGRGCQVRINGLVHLRTVLPPGTLVPIGWIAVGDPPLIAPPERHEDIWPVQRNLDFPGYVWGLPQPDPDAEGVPGAQMPEITRRFGRLLAQHHTDHVLDEPTATNS